METIELKLDEQNELVFKVVVEGVKDSDTKVRFVLEDKNMSFTFPVSNLGNGEVKVDLPPMKKMLSEGIYNGKLEVVAEDRYFEPLKFNVDMKLCVQIAEASVVQVNDGRKKTRKPVEVSASASIITEMPQKKSTNHVPKHNDTITIREAAKQINEVRKRSKKNLTESEVRQVIQRVLGGKRLSKK